MNNPFLDYYLNGSKTLSAPEQSYLYSSSAEMGPQIAANSLGSQGMASNISGPAAAAGAGFLAGGPGGAAIAAGSQFLTNYMAQRAADARARRDRAAQIAQQHSAGENQGYDTMMRALGGALR